jgi:periplasmic protein TonB
MELRAGGMAAHIDILESRESLRKPLAWSMALHTCFFALVALQTMIGRGPRELWGNPNSLGGSSVGITPVSQIPIPSRGGPVNRLASDTESSVPEPPEAKPQPRTRPEDDPAAIAIRGREAEKRRQRMLAQQRSRLATPRTPGQLYSTEGRALSTPMLSQSGSGGVGIGAGGAFGTRFGYYRDLLEQMVARRWRTNDVDPRLQTAPPVIVTFVIRRNGAASDIRLEQSSGNRALDYSALRAIHESAPFPPLPAGYERDDATIEFRFQLRR